MSPEIVDDELESRERSAKPNFGYYRQPNGYITASVISPMERLHYMEEGWEWLREYGTFDMTSEYAANNPFELLFMNGGAKEMPVAQLVELGLNIHPPEIPRCRQGISQYHKGHRRGCFPRTPVHFPQLTGKKLDTSYPCRFAGCSRALEENSFPTEVGRDQHENVMHKEEKTSLDTGKFLSDGIVSGLSKLFQSGGLAVPQIRNSPSNVSLIDALAKVEFTPEQIEQMKTMGIKLPEKE